MAAVRAAKSMLVHACGDQTCIRRTPSWLTREALSVATQPDWNSSRAWATSSWPPSTDSPRACTRRSGERTSHSTRSRSWIIRSSTTPTSVERKV
jgi:hypothetical protein